MERLEGGADEIRGKLKRSHKLPGGKARADPMECVEFPLQERGEGP